MSAGMDRTDGPQGQGTAGEAVLRRLGLLRERVAALVEHRSADDPTADDPLRGLYVSQEAAQRLAAAPGPRPGGPGDLTEEAAGGWDAHPSQGPAGPDGPSASDGPDRLVRLARRFELSPLDAHILLAALAPDADRGFEPLYGYLNDDVGRRRATVALALDLAGTGPYDAAARARFHSAAPLVAGGLLTIEDEDRPLPGRALRVPERVVAHLLGDDALDGELSAAGVRLAEAAGAGLSGPGTDGPESGSFTARLAALASAGPLAVHLRERRPGTAAEPAAEALAAAGLPVLRYDPERAGQDAARVAPLLVREARLRGAALVVGPVPERPGPLIEALAVPDATVVCFGSEPYDPGWAPDAALVGMDAPQDVVDLAGVWSAELGAIGDPGFALAETVAAYRLSAAQIRRAARTAAALAAFDGGPLTAAHVQHSARQQSAPLLDRHARRVRPAVGFEDLVLPEEPLGMLRELTQRARHRDQVLGQWRLRTGGGRGRGVIALFAGESGTGKTLSAEVVAGELGLDLYVVDLSAIVDKYVGETEKNLERIFVEADRTDAVLLFDEADAVFGKRSEVKSSHDRYANLESAYLLQRLESFDGVAVLTTNLRANIDDAFTRRLDLVVDFPFPDETQRVALWEGCLASTPCEPELGLELCAKEFELSGGAIRSAAVTAGYRAAGRGERVSAADVWAGAEREYRKMGRLVPGPALVWS
ncbi:ATP-binding protein [Streptomyces varsoviensis]|nr:AAA family ATPase [Streptomyces varsoviensis]